MRTEQGHCLDADTVVLALDILVEAEAIAEVGDRAVLSVPLELWKQFTGE